MILVSMFSANVRGQLAVRVKLTQRCPPKILVLVGEGIQIRLNRVSPCPLLRLYTLQRSHSRTRCPPHASRPELLSDR